MRAMLPLGDGLANAVNDLAPVLVLLVLRWCLLHCGLGRVGLWRCWVGLLVGCGCRGLLSFGGGGGHGCLIGGGRLELWFGAGRVRKSGGGIVSLGLLEHLEQGNGL